MPVIASKLPPTRTDTTYFNLGRSAFAFLVGEVVKPHAVYLPSLCCWSLIDTMLKRFPKIALRFYRVEASLDCEYPDVPPGAMLVAIHYFGHQAQAVGASPRSGCVVDDLSHSWLSDIERVGDFAFGSLRKVLRVGDGGFVGGRYNPLYERSGKTDTWLRYAVQGWEDMREAENMLDRGWELADMSSQALATILKADIGAIKSRRRANESYLSDNFPAGEPVVEFAPVEVPMVHIRRFATRARRDSLRRFLADRDVYAAVYWPTHPAVPEPFAGFADEFALRTFALPVSEDYTTGDMARICEAAGEWARGSGG